MIRSLNGIMQSSPFFLLLSCGLVFWACEMRLIKWRVKSAKFAAVSGLFNYLLLLIFRYFESESKI